MRRNHNLLKTAVIVFFCLFWSFATESVADAETRYLVAGGVESQFLQTEDNQNFSQNSPVAMIGIDWDDLILSIDYSWGSRSSTSGSLAVNTHDEETLLNVLDSVPLNEAIGLLIGAGAGGARSSANLQVAGQTLNADGAWKALFGLEFGVRFFPMSHWWVALEDRIQFCELYAPNPRMTALLTLGYEF